MPNEKEKHDKPLHPIGEFAENPAYQPKEWRDDLAERVSDVQLELTLDSVSTFQNLTMIAIQHASSSFLGTMFATTRAFHRMLEKVETPEQMKKLFQEILDGVKVVSGDENNG